MSLNVFTDEHITIMIHEYPYPLRTAPGDHIGWWDVV